MTGLDAKADSAVIEAVLDGDVQAYALLVGRYSARLLGLALHLTGDYDTASDLVQETLVAAYDNLGRLRNPSAFGAWTAGILRNKFRNLGRTHPAATLSLDQMMELGFDPPAPNRQSDDAVEADFEKVARCVGALPDPYREVLLLRYSDDLSYKEMAEFLHLPITTITTRLNQARKLLVRKARQEGLVAS